MNKHCRGCIMHHSAGRRNPSKELQKYNDWCMARCSGQCGMVLDTQKQKGSREMTQTIEQLTARIAELEEEKKELRALLDFDNARLDQIEDELEDVEYLGPFVEGIKVLKTQLAAAQEEWNQCSGLLDDAHRSIEMLEDQLATAEQRVTEACALLEEATSYTSCETWSPSLTDEINKFLKEGE